MMTLVGRRLLWGVPSFILVTILLFFSVAGMLGSPASLMLGRDATLQAIAELNAKYGFDRPLLTQYLEWMGKAASSDFEKSFSTHQTVAEAILPCLPVTLEIGLAALALATLAALLFNSVTTARAVVRPIASALAIVGLTIPNFILGLGLIYLFSVKLGWLPSVGWAPWSAGIGQHLTHILLPVLTLSAYYYGAITLVYQAEYDVVRQQLFVKVARAKGISELSVSFRHVLPNSVLPVITYVGLLLGQLMGGAVVTEALFSIPGVGGLFVSAIMARDYPVMLAIGMIIITSVVVMSMIADIVYTLVNPQIRLD
ncbi:MAG: ABC transporter permease [Alphaproteobacteria bacterium]|nr:ABC transporter permease [Alphaproteobacteria bacterium]